MEWGLHESESVHRFIATTEAALTFFLHMDLLPKANPTVIISSLDSIILQAQPIMETWNTISESPKVSVPFLCQYARFSIGEVVKAVI